MPHRDFNAARLAAYLHVSPGQVEKLAERGNLPGRKVAGEWRFARADVHHWLENRIGLSSGEELVQMETVLGRNIPADEETEISIAAMLPIEAIALPLAARTRGSVITSMVELAARTGWLWDPAAMAEAVKQREEMHPTALDIGVALLHPRRPMASILGQAFLALGRTDSPIPFGGDRGGMTDVFFLICSLSDRGHLRTLARLSRLIGSGELLSGIRQAADARQVHELIAEHEAKLLT